jgi:hypothetical protein
MNSVTLYPSSRMLSAAKNHAQVPSVRRSSTDSVDSSGALSVGSPNEERRRSRIAASLRGSSITVVSRLLASSMRWNGAPPSSWNRTRSASVSAKARPTAAASAAVSTRPGSHVISPARNAPGPANNLCAVQIPRWLADSATRSSASTGNVDPLDCARAGSYWVRCSRLLTLPTAVWGNSATTSSASGSL